jgi:ribose transport system permease protein
MGPLKRFLLSNEFGLIVLIVVFAIVFSTLSPMFLSKFSLFALGRTAAVNIMIGFAMMVVIVTGGLNLAVGAIGVSAAMFGGWLMQGAGLHWAPAVAGGACGWGALLGALNGIVIVRSGLHSFIITLATMSIIFGGMIFITQAQFLPRDLTRLLEPSGECRFWGVVPARPPPLRRRRRRALGDVCLHRARSADPGGRREPEAAAELSGIRVERTIIWSHALSGALAGLAGLMLVSRTGAAIPSMAGQLGQDWLLPAFLAPVLGGTLLTGGRVSVPGTLLGGFLVTMLTAGLLLMQIGAFWIQTFLGLLLLVAVLMDLARRSYLTRNKLA